MKRLLLISMLVGAVFASVLPQAGSLAPAEFSSTPTEGPSPNTLSVSGASCSDRTNPGLGPGIYVGGEVTVRLTTPDGVTTLAQQTYPGSANAEGTWGGAFAVPAGLAPATYPLKARCVTPPTEDRPQGGDIDYVDRSYKVLAAKAKKAPVVEAEVTFTG